LQILYQIKYWVIDIQCKIIWRVRRAAALREIFGDITLSQYNTQCLLFKKEGRFLQEIGFQICYCSDNTINPLLFGMLNYH